MDDAGRWKPTTAVDDRWNKFSAKLGFALMDTPTAAKTASVGDPGFTPTSQQRACRGPWSGMLRQNQGYYVLFRFVQSRRSSGSPTDAVFAAVGVC